jgi:long-chain acyl-CoA synthetase
VPSVYDQRPWLALYEEFQPQELALEAPHALALFRSACERYPDQPVMTYFDGTLTYRELDELSDGVANHLLANDFVRGDRLALYLQNVPQFVIALLGTWKAGGIVVPLNPMYRSRELTTILGDSRPVAIVSSEHGWRDVLGPLAADVRITLTTSELDLQTRDDPRVFTGIERRPPEDTADLLRIARQHSGHRPPEIPLHAKDIALITYTSGTSGVPKGATNTHENVTFNAESFRIRGRQGGIFALAPLFHITGMVCQVGHAFAVGGRLDLAYRFHPGVVLDALREFRPYYMVGPSTAYVALMNHPDVTADHFSSVDHLYSGGAPVAAHMVESFRERFGRYIRNGYGLTESTATATSVPQHLEAPVDPRSGTLSVGIPQPSTVMRIVDDSGADLPAGEVGEIVIDGPMVVPEYWNKPEETAIHNGQLHTGDVGFMDPQGWFYVVDRKKDMISASGFKVWPREVEDVLYGHPAVREAAVVGVPDPYRGETVHAYISTWAGKSVTAGELVEHCRRQMATYKYPRSIEILDELPKTASGKILRRQLRDEARKAREGTE